MQREKKPPTGWPRSRFVSLHLLNDRWAALDVHPRVAMQILRHSKIAVTMEIYTEVSAAATRDALRKVSQWLDS